VPVVPACLNTAASMRCTVACARTRTADGLNLAGENEVHPWLCRSGGAEHCRRSWWHEPLAHWLIEPRSLGPSTTVRPWRPVSRLQLHSHPSSTTGHFAYLQFVRRVT